MMWRLGTQKVCAQKSMYAYTLHVNTFQTQEQASAHAYNIFVRSEIEIITISSSYGSV